MLKPRLQYALLIFLLSFLGGCKKSINELPDFLSTTFFDSTSLNVKDYGAKADGITDDSKAFENAMDAAYKLKKNIFVPIGHYKANFYLKYDGLSLIGEAQPNQNLTGGTIIIGSINANNKKNILIANLGIDSRGQLAG